MLMPNQMNKLCFVLMPFKNILKEVYRQAIKPACEKAGFDALRVDELKGTYNINRKIIEHIFSSDAIVADLSGWNPNVFYELGVAHTIANKTIMIIQNEDKLPFDVSNYRCLQYEQTEAGLVKLREDIAESLQCLEEWRKNPTNPVQDFKPQETLVSADDLNRLQQELARKNELVAQVQTNNQDFQKKVARKEHAISQLKKNLANLRIQMPASQLSVAPVQLRSQFRGNIESEEIAQMLRERDFFDDFNNSQGNGLVHEYKTIEREGARLTIDYTTGLTWQQSGSPKALIYDDAERYIRDLKDQKFGNYNDWRLPTLEEAMSLVESEQYGDLYLDLIFDHTQDPIWTSDYTSSGLKWVVSFDGGGYWYDWDVGELCYVRAVRSEQAII